MQARHKSISRHQQTQRQKSRPNNLVAINQQHRQHQQNQQQKYINGLFHRSAPSRSHHHQEPKQQKRVQVKYVLPSKSNNQPTLPNTKYNKQQTQQNIRQVSRHKSALQQPTKSYSFHQPSNHSSNSVIHTQMYHSIAPQQTVKEKPRIETQREVDLNSTSSVSLSSFGYSLHSTNAQRQKSLYDAIQTVGYTPVWNRMSQLIERYENDQEVLSHLLDDYDWLEKYNQQKHNKQRFNLQREESRKKLYDRMQQKSRGKSNHKHSGRR